MTEMGHSKRAGFAITSAPIDMRTRRCSRNRRFRLQAVGRIRCRDDNREKMFDRLMVTHGPAELSPAEALEQVGLLIDLAGDLFRQVDGLCRSGRPLIAMQRKS